MHAECNIGKNLCGAEPILDLENNDDNKTFEYKNFVKNMIILNNDILIMKHETVKH